MKKMTFMEDLFNPKGIISAPIVLGVWLVLWGTVLGILTPLIHTYETVYPTFFTIGITASGLGAGESIMRHFMGKKK